MPKTAAFISEISIPISEILVLNQGALDVQATQENLVSRSRMQAAWVQGRMALIEFFYRKGLLSHDGDQTYWDALIIYGEAYRINNIKGCVEWLDQAGLLKSKECFSFLMKRNFSREAISFLDMLRKKEILDLPAVNLNLDVIAEHKESGRVVNAIQDSAKEGLLKHEECFSFVMKRNFSREAISFLLMLRRKEILDLPVVNLNLDVIAEHKESERVVNAIQDLAKEDLWSGEENVFSKVIVEHHFSWQVIDSFLQLKNAGILKSIGVRSNLEAICSQYGVLDAVLSLDKGLLTDEEQAEKYVKVLIEMSYRDRYVNDIGMPLRKLYKLGLKVPCVKEKSVDIIRHMGWERSHLNHFVNLIEYLHGLGLWNDEQQAQKNLEAIFREETVYERGFTCAKSLLEQKGLWNSKNAQLILKHGCLLTAEVLVRLHGKSNVQIVTENTENFDVLMKHIEENPDSARHELAMVYVEEIIHVIQILSQENGLLSGEGAQKNFNALMKYQHFYISRLIDVIVTLHAKGVLNQEIFDEVLVYKGFIHAVSLVKGINYLFEKNLLSNEEAQANLNLVLRHKDPKSMALALVILNTPAQNATDGVKALRDCVNQRIQGVLGTVQAVNPTAQTPLSANSLFTTKPDVKYSSDTVPAVTPVSCA